MVSLDGDLDQHVVYLVYFHGISDIKIYSTLGFCDEPEVRIKIMFVVLLLWN